MTEIVNNLSETKNKLTQKDKFNLADFSSVSKEFTNVFDKQFVNQFDYNNLFSAQESSGADFMSFAATNYSNNSSVEKDLYEVPSDSAKLGTEFQSAAMSEINGIDYEQQSNIAANSENNTYRHSDTAQDHMSDKAKENIQNNTSHQQEQKVNELKAQEGEKAEQKATVDDANEVTASAVKEEIKTEAKTQSSEEVALKAKVVLDAEVKTDAKPELRAEVKTELKGKDVEIKVQTEQNSDVKEVKEHTKSEVVHQAKAETSAEVKVKSKAIQNQASIERMNVKVETQEVNTEAKAEVKEDVESNKKVIDIVDRVMQKVQSNTSARNDNAANQQAFQNLAQHQNAQTQQTRASNIIAKGQINFDTTLAKANNQNNNVAFGKSVENSVPKQSVERNVVDQVLKQIKGNITKQNSTISMILKPAQLGKVTINILNQKGIMTTEIKAESQQAADALNKNIDELRHTLKEQGVTFENLVVKVDNSAKSENNTQFGFEQQNLKDFEGQNASNSNKNGKSQETSDKADVQSNQEVLAEEKQEQQEDSLGLVDYRV